jgi:hypothetical protein
MFKYRISAEQEQTTVAIREGAIIRAVGVQRSREICLWAEVPDDAPVITRTFRVIGTGGDVPDPGTYLGTVFDGTFVWHVYEVAP